MMGGDVDCSSKGVMGITVSERSSSLLIVVIYPLFYFYLQNSQAADLGNKRFGWFNQGSQDVYAVSN